MHTYIHSDKLMDHKKRSLISPDIIAKLYAGPRTQLDSMTKGIAGSIIPPGVMTQMWVGARIP